MLKDKPVADKMQYQKMIVADTLLTIKRHKSMVVVIIYVDDIITTGTGSDAEVLRAQRATRSNLWYQRPRRAKILFGIEVSKLDAGLFWSQRKYAFGLLSKAWNLGSKPWKTPIEENYKDDAKEKPRAAKKKYQRIVSKLTYLTITRHDICYAVNQVNKHMHAPAIHLWEWLKALWNAFKAHMERLFGWVATLILI